MHPAAFLPGEHEIIMVGPEQVRPRRKVGNVIGRRACRTEHTSGSRVGNPDTLPLAGFHVRRPDRPRPSAAMGAIVGERTVGQQPKVGEPPAPTLRGAPPAVATTHTSLGITPSGEVLTLDGVSSSRLWLRVKAIDFASGDQASSPMSKPSSSVYGVTWRALAPWDGSAIQMLLQPIALNTHATAAPVGAASMSDANGACITSLSV